MAHLSTRLSAIIWTLTVFSDVFCQSDFRGVVCPSYWFRCGNSTQCVHQKHWCDDTANCENGEDEEYLMCQDFGAWFNQATETLSNHEVNVKSQDLCIINHPAECRCFDNSTVDCRKRGLTSVPTNLSPETTRLVMGSNNFKLLPSEVFKNLKQLRVLSLDECHIRTILPKAFDGLENLNTLMLDNNSLESFARDTFTHTPKLKWLFISHNRLEHLRIDSFKGLHLLQWISLLNNRLTLDDDFPMSVTLSWLDLEHNLIHQLKSTTFSRTPNLTTLILDNNLIAKLERDAFKSVEMLSELSLSNNKVSHLPIGIFRFNKQLQTIRLNKNPITGLPVDLFKYNLRLVSLSLSDTLIEDLDKATFEHLTALEHVYMKYHDHCYVLPSYLIDCHPKTDGISDSKNLLAYPILRISVWFIACITLSGNFIVMSCRLVDVLKEKDKSIHLLSVTNLSAADFLMGVYLLIIGIFDVKFRDEFDVNYMKWAQSAGCQISGFIGMVSSEVSILILAYMSLERCINSSSPYRTGIITVKTACIFMLFIWLLGFLVASLPLMPIWRSSRGFYGTNGVCFPLHIHRAYKSGWEYSMLVFVVINSCALMVMIVCYTALFRNIQRTQKPVMKINKVAKTAHNKRIFFFVLTDSLCWIPIILIKLCALSFLPIPDALHAFVAVFVLPVNSAVNPLIYSLTTLTFRRKFLRIVCSKSFRGLFRKFSVNRRSTTSSTTISVTRETNIPDGSANTANGYMGLQTAQSVEVTYSTYSDNQDSSACMQLDDLSIAVPLKEEDVSC